MLVTLSVLLGVFAVAIVVVNMLARLRDDWQIAHDAVPTLFAIEVSLFLFWAVVLVMTLAGWL